MNIFIKNLKDITLRIHNKKFFKPFPLSSEMKENVISCNAEKRLN